MEMEVVTLKLGMAHGKISVTFRMQPLSEMGRRMIIGTEVDDGLKIGKTFMQIRDIFVTMGTFVLVGGVLTFVTMKELMEKAQMWLDTTLHNLQII